MSEPREPKAAVEHCVGSESDRETGISPPRSSVTHFVVFDVAASCGGALTVLEDYRNQVARSRLDARWTFVVSGPHVDESERVSVITVPWIKRSWIHRIAFELLWAPALVRRLQPSRVLSLQNVAVVGVRVRQNVFIHNALPFADYRPRITADPVAWVYRNLIGRLVRASARYASEVTVQSSWLKDELVQQLSLEPACVHVVRPGAPASVEHPRAMGDGRLTLFYPASAAPYKNHEVILGAAKCLLDRGMQGFQVVFTLQEDDSRRTRTLARTARMRGLPVCFSGHLAREEVLRRFAGSVLVFPSLVETVGLPLIEARAIGGMVIAADLPYAREALTGYSRVAYFDPTDVVELADAIQAVLVGGSPRHIDAGPFAGQSDEALEWSTIGYA